MSRPWRPSNVPARTGVDFATATVGQPARIPTIVGIEDATGRTRRAPARVTALVRAA